MRLKWNIITASGSTFSGTENLRSGPLHVKEELHDEIREVSASVPVKTARTERIFMNGFQTWTSCPEYTKFSRIRGVNGLPKRIIDRFSLDRYGDYHFVNYPMKRGILHGFSYCYFRRGSFYRLFASLDEEPGYTMFRYDSEKEVLTIQRDSEGLQADGEYHAFDLFYAEGSEDSVFDAWFRELGIQPRIKEKLYGYSSWYNRYQDIDEACIRQDLEGCAGIFRKNDLFQIDDGWEPFIGDWLEADQNKFPGGMKQAADEIHAKGFRAGIWLAPFVAEEKSGLFRNHPDWFLKHDGEPWKDGCNWSGFYSLDIDHPEVMDYLRRVFDRVLNEWGYDLVKLDFLYGAAPFGTRNETRAGRMIRAMKFLREVCGSKLILGCGVPVMPAFGLVDYCRIGCDATLDWNDKPHMRIIHRERPSTRQAVGNIISRRHLNGRAYLSDPDVFFLRDENLRLSAEQKRSLGELNALFGGVFLISDDPGKYTEKMKKEYERLRHLSESVSAYLRFRGGLKAVYLLDGKEHITRLFEKGNLRFR